MNLFPNIQSEQTINEQKVRQLVHAVVTSQVTFNTKQTYEHLESLLQLSNYRCLKVLQNIIIERSGGKRPEDQRYCQATVQIYYAFVLKFEREISIFRGQDPSNKEIKQKIQQKRQVYENMKNYIENMEIKYEYKEIFLQLEFKLTIAFEDNIQRYTNRIDHFMKIQQVRLALGSISAFAKCQQYYKFKDDLYKTALPKFIQKFQQVIKVIDQIQQGDNINLIEAFLDSFIIIIETWNLSYHQIFFERMVSSSSFESVYHNLCKTLSLNAQMSKIILFLTKFIQKFRKIKFWIKKDTVSQLTRNTASLLYDKWKQNQFTIQQIPLAQNLTIFLCECISSQFLKVDLHSQDLDTIFFKRIYILFKKFFSENFSNMQEIYNFFKDASFDMQSEILPILTNKFLYLCCNGNGWKYDNFMTLRKQMIHRLQIWRKQFEKQFQLPLQGYDQGTYLNLFNLILALQVKLFMCDAGFLMTLQNCYLDIFEMIPFTLDDENVFFLTLVYDNYMDDIWFGDTGNKLEGIIRASCSAQGEHSVIQNIEIKLMRHKLNLNFPEQYVLPVLNRLSELISGDKIDSVIPLMVIIIEKYCQSEHIQKYFQIIYLILQNLQQTLSTDQQQVYLEDYIVLLAKFFKNKLFYQYFPIVRDKIYSVFIQKQSSLWSVEVFQGIFAQHLAKHMNEALDLRIFLNTLNLEENNDVQYCAFMSHILWSQNIKEGHQIFLNNLALSIIPSTNVSHVLLLHDLLNLYQNSLTEKTIKEIIFQTLENIFRIKKGGQFILGKLQLTLLLLLANEFQRTMNLMKQMSQNMIQSVYVQKQFLINDMLTEVKDDNSMEYLRWRIMNRLGCVNSDESLTFELITLVCHKIIYSKYHNYRLGYDIPMFIAKSSEVFVGNYQNVFQRKMAPLILTGLLRCAQILKKKQKVQIMFNMESATQGQLYAVEKETDEIIDRMMGTQLERIDWLSSMKKMFHLCTYNPELKEWFERIMTLLFVEEKLKFKEQLFSMTLLEGKHIRSIREVHNQ